MSNETPERRGSLTSLPPSLEAWLVERAAASGVDPDELLVELLTAVRTATDTEAAESLDDLVAERVEAHTERVLGARSDEHGDAGRSLDTRTDDRLEQVRRRVVQLKRETDGKAAAERVERLEGTVEELEARFETLESSVGRTEATLTDLEATLETLEGTLGETENGVSDERLDDVDAKLSKVARAVVSLRDAEAERNVLRRLKRTAARASVSRAACVSCAEEVDLSLLPEPSCPHCGESIGALDVDGGDRPTLTNGEVR